LAIITPLNILAPQVTPVEHEHTWFQHFLKIFLGQVREILRIAFQSFSRRNRGQNIRESTNNQYGVTKDTEEASC